MGLKRLPPAIGALPGRLGHAPDRAADPAKARAQQNQAADRARGSRQERGYGPAWVKASRAFLAAHPVCDYCRLGVFGPAKVSASTLTDHLYPQRQFDGVFWRRDLWVASCKPCHDGPKQALERRGKAHLDDLARRLGRAIL